MIAGAGQKTLKALGARRDPVSGRYVGPDEKTVRRVCARVDGNALDEALGRWVARRLLLAAAARSRIGGKRTHGKASRRRKAAGQRRKRKSTWGRHVP